MSKAERTRQFIIEKTAPIFNQKGYAGTSISDLTEATGLTKGSIYGNFSNKDEVALSAFDHNYGLIKATIRLEMDKVPDTLDKLRVWLKVFSEVHTNEAFKYGCPVLNTAIESDDTHTELRKKAIAAINNWYSVISEIIKKGQEEGRINADVNHAEFAGAYIAIIEGGVMLAKVTGKMDGLNAVIKQAKKMITDIAV